MADYQALSSRFHKESNFTSQGVIEPINGTRIYGERSLVIAVENVQGENEILVQGKMQGANDWINISKIKGALICDASNLHILDIGRYDLIRFNCDIYSPAQGKIPKLIASGFYTDPKTNSGIEELLATQNKYFLELNCNVKRMQQSIERLELQLQAVTGLELNGD